MRNVILYIAMSLDGFIADRQGGVGWLQAREEDGTPPDSDASFFQEVDTVVMGWNTYHQIVTELSPGEWVYEGLECYVVTHRKRAPETGIRFTDRDPCALIRDLRRSPGRSIWVCGGADTARQLMAADLIDEYDLTVLPILLGGGIRLFESLPEPLPLRLVFAESGGGFARWRYRRRAPV